MRNNVLSMKKITDEISLKNIKNQQKNKNWWEKLPMTYAEWDKKDRIPKNKKDFLRITAEFLNGNPYLRDKFKFEEFKNEKILEIGCGSGAASCLFAKNGAIVTATDITSIAIKITKKNSRLQGLNVLTKQEDAEKLTFAKDTFDYIFSWGVLHHSKDTQRTFNEVARVLKRKGKGLIMVYNKNSLRYYINGLNWLILKGKIFKGYNLRTVQDFYTDGYYHKHFTPNELKKAIKIAGLTPTEVLVTHMGTRFAPFLPKFIENWLKNHFGWLLIIKFKKE